jgi:hypothetical protein
MKYVTKENPMTKPTATDWLPASEAEKFSPDAYQHVWNDDYSMFRAFPLRWTDDASYAAFQADAGAEDFDA